MSHSLLKMADADPDADADGGLRQSASHSLLKRQLLILMLMESLRQSA
jgi:hypothetical protein